MNLRIILFLFGLIGYHNYCEAKRVQGYILKPGADTLYGEIKVRKFNTLTGGYTFSGINMELFHIEVSFKGNGERGFKTYSPEDISGFGFQYQLTDFIFRSFILESKSITRNDRERYRFLSLEHEGIVSLYKDLIRVNSTSDMTRGTTYVYSYYYLLNDLIGLKKVEIRDDIKSLVDLLAIYGFEKDFLDGIPADANPKDIKALLEAYEAWYANK